MARKADQRAGEIERPAQIAVAGVEAGFAHALIHQPLARPAPYHAGERGDDVLGQTHYLADLADRAARAVGDQRGGEAGMVAAVSLIDVLDHLLAPFMF